MTTYPNNVSPDTRILVVDDNADAALIVSMSLRLRGYNAQCGDSGLQTLSIAEVWQPRAILLDISMPGMDGYETCRRLRQQPWGKDMILIALTGYGQSEDYQRSEQAGFDRHLVKPVDLDTLARVLEVLLD